MPTANTHGLSEAELASMTEAEREALTADLSEDEQKLAGGGAGVVEEPEKPAEKAAEAAPATAATPAAPAAPGAEPAAAPAAAGADEPEERSPLVVPYQARDVDPAKVKQSLVDLKEKFDNGDITMDLYLDERDKITRAVTKAELSSEYGEQVRTALWENEIDRFLDGHKEYKDPTLYRSLDAEIKAIAVARDKDGNLIHEKASDRQILTMAHEQVTRARGGAAAPAAKPAADAAAAVAASRKQDLSHLPTTLATVPAAAPQTTDGDQFSGLDALSKLDDGGVALEQALAKLTPAQQDAYLRGA
jgi:hypothetical protein